MKQEVFTCPVGHKLLVNRFHPFVADIHQGPFVKTVDGIVMGESLGFHVTSEFAGKQSIHCTDCPQTKGCTISYGKKE